MMESPRRTVRPIRKEVKPKGMSYWRVPNNGYVLPRLQSPGVADKLESAVGFWTPQGPDFEGLWAKK
jgi:hypothetical protein